MPTSRNAEAMQLRSSGRGQREQRRAVPRIAGVRGAACLDRQAATTVKVDPLPGSGRHDDVAAHRIDQPLAHRQAKARAAELPRRRLIRLAERLEDRADARCSMPTPVSVTAKRSAARSPSVSAVTSISHAARLA